MARSIMPELSATAPPIPVCLMGGGRRCSPDYKVEIMVVAGR
jgi:hypothetical protein